MLDFLNTYAIERNTVGIMALARLLEAKGILNVDDVAAIKQAMIGPQVPTPKDEPHASRQ